MSLRENDHFEETAREAEAEREAGKDYDQQASIILSRSSLEKLEFAYSDLERDELIQIREALKAMRLNDDLKRNGVKPIPVPKGYSVGAKNPMQSL